MDGDGKDEIIYGACCIDDDGKGLYTTGLGHGDALHLSDIDPDRPGLEVFDIHERPRHPNGAEFRDARTGRLLWGKRSPDVGRGVAMDIDPRHRGYEMWASGQGLSGLWNVKGETISDRKPRSCNFGVWWDGDLLREILDRNRITKWNWETGSESTLLVAEGCTVEQRDEIDSVSLRGHPRRLAGRSHLADARQSRAAHLHDHDPHRTPALYPDARSPVPPLGGLAERRLQPADPAGVLSRRRHGNAPAASNLTPTSKETLMSIRMNRQILLAARPQGEPKESDLKLVETPVPDPGPGQMLLRTLYLSLDPYMRGRMNAGPSYAAPVEIGEVMTGATVSRVEASNSVDSPSATSSEPTRDGRTTRSPTAEASRSSIRRSRPSPRRWASSGCRG